jgi:universal stress protein E
MYRKILLLCPDAVDSAPALRRAAAIAKASGAAIEVFDPVYEPALEAYYGSRNVYDPVRERLVKSRQTVADNVAVRLRDDGLAASAAAVWADRVDRSVARRVLEGGFDLVVTASTSQEGSHPTHADWRLVSMCPVPVLICRDGDTQPYRRIAAAVDPLHAHAKPAELDDAILAHAKAIGELSGAQLAVVHCFVPLSQLATGIEADLPWSDTQQAFDDAITSTLHALLDKAGLSGATLRLLPGRPEAELRKMAEQGEADLVVMGALSRSGLRALLVGSTAERFMRRSQVDVLFVNPPGMSFAD